MKNNYNPFKMWLTYLLGILLVILAVGGFYFGFQDNKLFTFFDTITPGEIFKTIDTSIDINSQSLLMINPIAMLVLFIYGFVLGWIIQSLFKLGRKK
jgi:uncharacterized membrane protein YciS (DUF1049 family)